MPITAERQNIADLRAVGFTEQQAVVLAEKLETAAQAVSQDLKGFIVTELDKRFGPLRADMELRFAQMEARFERSMRLQLATILSALVGVVGVAVAIIKLFP